MKPRILIIGHKKWGKTDVTEIMGRYGLIGANSSEFATERVMMPYFASIGKPYASAAECFEDRINHRVEWFREIENYNTPDWSRMISEVYGSGHDVYAGLRSRQEFEASRHWFDHIVWVDASARLDPESSDSMQLTRDDATVVLDNNGPLDDLPEKVHELLVDTLKIVIPDIVDGQTLYRIVCQVCLGTGLDTDSINPVTMSYSECMSCGGFGSIGAN